MDEDFLILVYSKDFKDYMVAGDFFFNFETYLYLKGKIGEWVFKSYLYLKGK